MPNLRPNMNHGKWLIPFKGRNHSGATEQNFLWQHGDVYFMDNHRAAMWCWLQHLPRGETINLLHIDEHYDTLYSQIDAWLAAMPPLDNLSIDEYLALSYRSSLGDIPLIRWDNYLSLFLERYRNVVKSAVFATHGVGDEPRVAHAMHVDAWDLGNNIEHWIADERSPWIVNVDLDYFFCSQDDRRQPMFSPQYINSVFEQIRRSREAGQVICTTVCLTPDEPYTGGWENAERLCSQVSQILGVPFELPPPPLAG